MKLNEITKEEDFFNQLAGHFTKNVCLSIFKEFLNNCNITDVRNINEYDIGGVIIRYLNNTKTEYIEGNVDLNWDQSIIINDSLIRIKVIKTQTANIITIQSSDGWEHRITIRQVRQVMPDNKSIKTYYSSTIQNQYKNTVFYKIHKE